MLFQQITSSCRIDDGHQNVARAERVIPPIPKRPNISLRKCLHQSALPLRLQFGGRYEDKNFDSLAERLKGGGDADHRLAGSRDGFDDASAI